MSSTWAVSGVPGCAPLRSGTKAAGRSVVGFSAGTILIDQSGMITSPCKRLTLAGQIQHDKSISHPPGFSTMLAGGSPPRLEQCIDSRYDQTSWFERTRHAAMHASSGSSQRLENAP